MEACGYRPWHDKGTGKTFLRPDIGKCLQGQDDRRADREPEKPPLLANVAPADVLDCYPRLGGQRCSPVSNTISQLHRELRVVEGSSNDATPTTAPGSACRVETSPQSTPPPTAYLACIRTIILPISCGKWVAMSWSRGLAGSRQILPLHVQNYALALLSVRNTILIGCG